MKLALVAMPWSTPSMPSPALGLLSAQVKRRLPGTEVSCVFPYLDVAKALGQEGYHLISNDAVRGETVYAAHLYPEMRERATARLARWIAGQKDRPDLRGQTPEEAAAAVMAATAASVHETVEALAQGYDVVGFTTTFAQLFSSLAVARLLRERSTATIVMGGMSVAFDSGPSILREYPFVDYVVQGEGEEPLVALLSALQEGRACAGRGILSRGANAPEPPPGARSAHVLATGEVKDLDTLPVPDYDAFAEEAGRRRLMWTIPVEGSRGCWWDRVARTNDPMKICYFCGLNSSSYREKSIERVAAELDELSDRYGILRFQFLDNIIRHKDVHAFCDRIRGLGKDLLFFYEVRANIRPSELLALWEAGCQQVQVGIEGLSSSYLRRIGKGTTTIQNLQAMRTCYELGIDSVSNLLTHFPGATAEEIAETAQHVSSYGVYYQPLQLSYFDVYEGSSVARVPEQFSVSRLRNSRVFHDAVPAEVLERVRLHFLDYDDPRPPQDWGPVEAACDRWRQVHRELRAASIGQRHHVPLRTLTYRDGGSFLEITSGMDALLRYRLNAAQRSVYLYCMEVRTLEAVARKLHGLVPPARVESIVEGFVARRLMFREGEKVLSLAVAPSAEAGARRLRSQQEPSAEPASPALVSASSVVPRARAAAVAPAS